LLKTLNDISCIPNLRLLLLIIISFSFQAGNNDVCVGCVGICVTRYLQVLSLPRSFFAVMLPNCFHKLIKQICLFIVILSRLRFRCILHLYFHHLVGSRLHILSFVCLIRGKLFCH